MHSHRDFTFCTICFSKARILLNVFDNNEREIELPVIIRDLLQFEVLQEGCIPWMICINCIMKLKEFNQFKKHATKCKDFLEYTLLYRKKSADKTKENLFPVTVEKERDECEIHLTPEKDSTAGDSVPSDDEIICLFHASVSEAKEAMPVKSEESPPEIYLPVTDSSGIGDCHSDYEHQSQDASGTVSEVAEEEELSDQDDLHLHLSSSSSDEEECVSNVSGKESEVTGVNCTDLVGAPFDGVEERLGHCEETLGGDKDTEGLEGTGLKSSAPIQQGKMVLGATQSYLKQRRLTSHSRDENYCPNEETESNSCNTSGKQFAVKIGRHTQRNKGINTEREHGNGPPVKDILIGSSIRDDKPEGQDLMCDKCGQGFKSKVLIERHVKFPCVTDASECGICNQKFCTKHQYKRHKPLHCVSNVPRRRAQIRVAVDVIGESESQIKKRIPHTCNICSKTFSSKGNLKRHRKTVHLMERNFLCETCGKAFGQKQQLKFHMAYHTGVKPYICSHCEKGFTQSGDLRQHIRAVHEMEKPHTCGECGKAFSQKHVLKTHMLVHTGERPHACDICSRSFSHKHRLESHMLMHTGEKPHACDICSRSFSHKHRLESHMLMHTGEKPHACDICSRSFSLKQNLQSHMLIHTAEKPHTCTLCSKTFRQNVHLKRHMATHARNVPHQ